MQAFSIVIHLHGAEEAHRPECQPAIDVVAEKPPDSRPRLPKPDPDPTLN
jgi:hypothetical protein